MSSFDRGIRLLIVAVIAVLYFTNSISGILAIVLLIAAGIFLLTSLAGSCPMYSLFGISTCKVNKDTTS